jgi:hypothetical protein
MAPFQSPLVKDSIETATKIQMVRVACWAVPATTVGTRQPTGSEWHLQLAGLNQSMPMGRFVCWAHHATSALKAHHTGTAMRSLHVGVSPNGLTAHCAL